MVILMVTLRRSGLDWVILTDSLMEILMGFLITTRKDFQKQMDLMMVTHLGFQTGFRLVIPTGSLKQTDLNWGIPMDFLMVTRWRMVIMTDSQKEILTDFQINFRLVTPRLMGSG
jgi:hypothetical protein